jgi:uncharacterized protein Yka (UPF0111/DUF47 family)
MTILEYLTSLNKQITDHKETLRILLNYKNRGAAISDMEIDRINKNVEKLEKERDYVENRYIEFSKK